MLKNLVERRKLVKKWMKNEKEKNEKADPIKVQQLDIQQQALKLTANRCLFFFFFFLHLVLSVQNWYIILPSVCVMQYVWVPRIFQFKILC